MTIIDIIFLALALSVDAAIVSFSCGLIIRQNRHRQALKLAFATGGGQFVMPVLGWYLAHAVSFYLKHFNGIISSLVFILLGLNIIYKAIKHKEEEPIICSCLKGSTCLLLGFATSIDAGASGVTLFFLQQKIWFPALIIGLITFGASYSAFLACNLFKKLPLQKVEIASGFILIVLGIKIIFEQF